MAFSRDRGTGGAFDFQRTFSASRVFRYRHVSARRTWTAIAMTCSFTTVNTQWITCSINWVTWSGFHSWSAPPSVKCHAGDANRKFKSFLANMLTKRLSESKLTSDENQ